MVLNPEDATEKTHAYSSTYYDGGPRLTVGRYDTAEAHTCFRLRETAGLTILTGNWTVLGRH
jgi:hypothetical protein